MIAAQGSNNSKSWLVRKDKKHLHTPIQANLFICKSYNHEFRTTISSIKQPRQAY